jgi:hypothetical protein
MTAMPLSDFVPNIDMGDRSSILYEELYDASNQSDAFPQWER